MVLFSLLVAVILLGLQIRLFLLARKSVDRIVADWQKEALAPVNSMLSGIELMKGLDHRFVTDRYFEYLRRAGTAAPMVGVAISAITLLTTSETVSMDGEGTPRFILQDVFYGVLVGVVLSCVNQTLLAMLYRTYHLRRQTVDLQVNEVNMAAAVSRATGDLKVQIEEATQLLKRRFSAAMDECAALVSTTQERLAKENQTLAETISTTTALHRTVSTFISETLPTRIEASISTTMTQVALGFGKLESALARQVHEVSRAVEQCGQTQASCEKSVKEMTASVKSFEGAIEILRTSAKTLQTGITDLSTNSRPKLNQCIAKLSTDTQILGKSIENIPRTLDASTKAFQQTIISASAMSSSLTDSSKVLTLSSGQIGTAANASADLLTRAAEAAQRRVLVETFPAMQQLEKSLLSGGESIQKFIEALATTTQPAINTVANADKLLREITPVYTDLSTVLKNMQTGSREIISMAERQAASIKSWSAVADDLPQRLEKRLVAAVEGPLQGLTHVVAGTQRLISALESLLQQLTELSDSGRRDGAGSGFMRIIRRGR